MRFDRLLAGVAATALMAGSALAQTGGSMMQPTSPTGAGAMQSAPGAPQPYAPPPTTGGPAMPSNRSMGPGSMAPGSTMSQGGTMAGGGAFTPITPMPSASIIATLQASGQFTKLLAALQATNLTSLISTHPNLTLFAPTDAAFAALPPGTLDSLMKSPAQLQAILTYHLIAAKLPPSDIKGHAASKIPTADTKPTPKSVTIDGSGATIMVDTASVLQPGVPASNGYIYPIDKVLMPAA